MLLHINHSKYIYNKIMKSNKLYVFLKRVNLSVVPSQNSFSQNALRKRKKFSLALPYSVCRNHNLKEKIQFDNSASHVLERGSQAAQEGERDGGEKAVFLQSRSLLCPVSCLQGPSGVKGGEGAGGDSGQHLLETDRKLYLNISVIHPR